MSGVRRVGAWGLAVVGAVSAASGMFELASFTGCLSSGCEASPGSGMAFVVGGMIAALVAAVTGAGGAGFGLGLLGIGAGALGAVQAGQADPMLAMFGTVALGMGGLAVTAGVIAERRRRGEDRIRAEGADAVATVLAIADTRTSQGDDPRVRLRLQLHPADESAPYEVELTEVVSRVAVPRPGDRLPVRYDRADRSKIVLLDRPQPGGGPRGRDGSAVGSAVGSGGALAADSSDDPGSVPSWGTADSAGSGTGDVGGSSSGGAGSF